MRTLYSLAPAEGKNARPAPESKGDAGDWQKTRENSADAPAATQTPEGEAMAWKLDPEKTRAFFRQEIMPRVEREPEHVRIFRNAG